MKPRSSIWSASSNTRNCVSSRRTAPRSIRSSKRPGVATRIEVPFSRRRLWPVIPAPPTTRTVLRCEPEENADKLSAICFASSRVGARISARVVFGEGFSPFFISASSIGRPKAAVLPVPVWARPITSRPFIACGIACAWIGVGSVMPSSASLVTRRGASPSISKSIKILFRAAQRATHWSGPAPETARVARIARLSTGCRTAGSTRPLA